MDVSDDDDDDDDGPELEASGDDRPESTMEELKTVGRAVSGIGSLVGEWLTSVSGCPETDALTIGEALYPCVNPDLPPLSFLPASMSGPGSEMDDVDGEGVDDDGVVGVDGMMALESQIQT